MAKPIFNKSPLSLTRQANENESYNTMDEINGRPDKAEQDFDAGLGRTSEEVFKKLDEKFHLE